MNRLLLAITMVLVMGGLPAYAGGSSRVASYQGYSSGQLNSPSGQVVNTRGSVIYNMTVMATSTGATLAIYDSPVFPFTSVTQEIPIYEVEVSASGDSRSVDMSAAPLQTYNGIVASVSNGVAYINLEK